MCFAARGWPPCRLPGSAESSAADADDTDLRIYTLRRASALAGQVQRIPVEDHCPPLLIEVVRFCEDVTNWMRRDPRNVIAAHCKVRSACRIHPLPASLPALTTRVTLVAGGREIGKGNYEVDLPAKIGFMRLI